MTLGSLLGGSGVIFEARGLLFPPRRSQVTPSRSQSRFRKISWRKRSPTHFAFIQHLTKGRPETTSKKDTEQERTEIPPQTLDFEGFDREGLQKNISNFVEMGSILGPFLEVILAAILFVVDIFRGFFLRSIPGGTSKRWDPTFGPKRLTGEG